MGSTVGRFGEPMGQAHGVIAYANGRGSWDKSIVEHNGKQIYAGMKYQCVEYARRFLLLTLGFVFEDVNCACDIFHLKQVYNPHTQEIRFFQAFEQDGTEPPKIGDLIIYKRSMTLFAGHVSVVVEVKEDQVLIAEQNYELWKSDKYARSIKLNCQNGKYHLTNHQPGINHRWDHNQVILGWMRVI